MADLKNKPTDASVETFLQSIADDQRRADCRALVAMMQDVTGEPPKMWGPSMVGFGSYHYRYESGREGDWFLTGFSPRKQNLTLYIMAGFSRYADLLRKLGKHKTGKSCLYLKRLEDVDQQVLRELVAESVEHIRQAYG